MQDSQGRLRILSPMSHFFPCWVCSFGRIHFRIRRHSSEKLPTRCSPDFPARPGNWLISCSYLVQGPQPQNDRPSIERGGGRGRDDSFAALRAKLQASGPDSYRYSPQGQPARSVHQEYPASRCGCTSQPPDVYCTRWFQVSEELIGWVAEDGRTR